MAQIVINEISQNYTYNIGTNSFATVALPITSCWGPAFIDPASSSKGLDELLEETSWEKFSATQSGLESFVATYRGPASNYRLAKDYSYQIAMTLLTAGYDVLVCRLCPGSHSQATIGMYSPATAGGETAVTASGSLVLKAKYPGSFGNNLKVKLTKSSVSNYWSLVTYVVDTTGVQTAVENIAFVFDVENSTDSILHIDEVESNFLTFVATDCTDDSELGAAPSTTDASSNSYTIQLADGYDKADKTTPAAALSAAVTLATARYTSAYPGSSAFSYVTSLTAFTTSDLNKANTIMYCEWLYTYACKIYDLLKDKLNYSPQRIISPGWDDQDICSINGDDRMRIGLVSPIHAKLLEVGYYSRCATSYIDSPRSATRSSLYNESTSASEAGYVQLLSRYQPTASAGANFMLYSTHSALFAPWATYQYAGTNKQMQAPPSFLALMIQRSMILNQSLQYEWALPTNRQNYLNIGKFEYKVPKSLLDTWQKLEGASINVITAIPSLGTGIWGNSTLFEVPPATYQALANLSTRLLVNAVENVAYRCGVSITFQYNNEQAYNKFYAGVTPTLDTMKNVGAIDDYYVKVAADINGLDQVNANTVIGKIYLVINGVINDIAIDLIALPPGVDLGQYKG